MIDARWQVRRGDVVDEIPKLGAGAVDCIVTSPPYFGLRSYGVAPTAWPEVIFRPVAGLPPLVVDAQAACLGLEGEPWAYVAHLVHIFRELRRVLSPAGTLWLNLGDTYVAGRNGGIGSSSVTSQRNQRAARDAWLASGGRTHRGADGLKPKDLLGIPWRVALALQADGWFLRRDIVWRNPCPQPESVRDRPTREHEFVFLLSRSRRYFYDAAAIAEPVSSNDLQRRERERRAGGKMRVYTTRNKRTVWTMAHERKTSDEDHTATFPEQLAATCIRAGSPSDGLVLDPFCGRGTAGRAALLLGRRFLGIDASETHTVRARAVCAAAVEQRGEATPELVEAKRGPVQLGLLVRGGSR